MGEMRVMGRPGDTKVMWNPENENEVAAAKTQFEDLVTGKRFRAYNVTEGGDKGVPMTRFDPQAGKVIIVPPMAGGC